MYKRQPVERIGDQLDERGMIRQHVLQRADRAEGARILRFLALALPRLDRLVGCRQPGFRQRAFDGRAGFKGKALRNSCLLYTSRCV